MDTAFTRAVDSLVITELRRARAPGAQLTILHGGAVLQRAYGILEAAAPGRVTRETLFPIGSITKSFTAAAVLTLVSEGRMSLDGSIAGYWPERSLDNRVTLRHLLNHTSGLRPYESLIPNVGAFARSAVRSDTILSFVSGQSLQFEPGQRWSYSNTGYHILGLAVERASGSTYFDYVEKRLTRPARLTATRPCASGSNERQASGHEVEARGLEKTTLPHVSFSFAAGALCSTATEVARWLRALPSLLGVAPYATMIAPTTLRDGRRHPYGFGLLLGELGEHEYIAHGGSLPGFDSFVADFRRDSLTIALFVNVRPFDGEGVVKRIARMVLGVAEPSVADLPLPTSEREKFVGTYTIDGRSLRIANGASHLRLLGPGDFTLSHQGDLLFVAREEPDVQVRFVVERGAVTGMIFTSPGRRFELQRNP